MAELRLESLSHEAAERIRPFLDEVASCCGDKLHSAYIVGSAVTGDFDAKHSDINSILVLNAMDFGFLSTLARLGKKFGKKKIAAPIVMTPDYIKNSLDVFPVEFLTFKLIHETVYGEDILKDTELTLANLRHQCERELKVKLIGLRQGYISSLGDLKNLTEGLAHSIAGYMPLFRGIILLTGKTPPVLRTEVLKALSGTGVDCSPFERVSGLKERKLNADELNALFESYYKATERLAGVVDEIRV